MQQYLNMLKVIREEGTAKPPAREGMPGSKSLFGYNFRHNLQDGFPLLTTKKMFWKGIVVELLWFLKGDTNIKYLVDNGVNIWNEDAYNYYLKQIGKKDGKYDIEPMSLEIFIERIKDNKNYEKSRVESENYKLGDCGFQYGKVWRRWRAPQMASDGTYVKGKLDQIANLIEGLKRNPESRRHIVTAIDPAHDQDLALYWCHAMFQFNCRAIPFNKRIDMLNEQGATWDLPFKESVFDKWKIPKYYLDCQLYQRSADAVLGVPFNIASYALLTHIIAKICNMVVGDLIISYGDLHIYDNHWEAVEEQLGRTPEKLPILLIGTHSSEGDMVYKDIDTFAKLAYPEMFPVTDYLPYPPIKAELSTGLKK